MALSNSQYDQLMRDYEQLQLDNEHELRLRFDEVYAKIPKLRTIDDTISSLSVEKAKRLLEGDEDALSSFHEKLLTLTGEKQKLLRLTDFHLIILKSIITVQTVRIPDILEHASATV